MQSLKKSLSILIISFLFLGCAEESVPSFPDISVCKIVWQPTIEATYCRCVSVLDPSQKVSLAKEECNVSLRPGHYAMLIEYSKELERKLKKSYRKPFAQNVNKVKEAAE